MPPRRDSLSPAQREREQREREREERDRRDREREREWERDREREQRDREREQDREREERPPAKSAPGAAGAMAGPPQMGQLLSAQATRPTLCNTFFVGDVFTKHACTRLQSLAANVRIVNMYGAIETQCAVSYSAIPSVADNPAFLATQKNIMPAGERMTDFQLLVVNRNDRDIPCAVGEVGEIYVVIY